MDNEVSSAKEIEEKIVIHYKDGSVKKGILQGFSEEGDKITIKTEKDKGERETIDIFLSKLKAIYYVKSHEGRKEYREKRQFGLSETKGKRVMVRFKDGEIICGFVSDEIQSNGSFMPSSYRNFFVFPSDPDTNNTKIFIIASSVSDIRRL